MLLNLEGKLPFYIKHTYEEHPVQESFPMHAHSHYEILIFISGDITYLVEGNSYSPEPWDILIFNVAESHKVVVNSDTPYERLVIQFQKDIFSGADGLYEMLSPFQSRALGQNNLLHPSDFRDDLWKMCALRLIDEPSPNKKITNFSLLLPILREIHQAFLKHRLEDSEISLAAKIVLYVNNNITEDISPATISQKFLISRTALYSLFRNATGAGIHNYINVKRLILAQKLLKDGTTPTRVYEAVGFRDYTVFFRAYKSHFGKSPKSDYRARG